MTSGSDTEQRELAAQFLHGLSRQVNQDELAALLTAVRRAATEAAAKKCDDAITELRQRVVRAEADAERYRYLRTRIVRVDYSYGVTGGMLDGEIDAARKGKP